MNKLMLQNIGLLYLVVERVPIGNPGFSYPHAPCSTLEKWDFMTN